MTSKLWEKNVSVDSDVEKYTVGRDREMDLFLAPYDVLGSLAHIAMLEKVGLLGHDEHRQLHNALTDILADIRRGDFVIEDDVEDVHSQVEILLTRRLGDMGKRIHSGRSRNDQVLVDLKLFIRSRIHDVVTAVKRLFDTLMAAADRYRDVIIPGYTHFQVAMPSSVGLWLAAYGESLVDDLTLLHAAHTIADRNPLGSAAGYGSSFPLDREMTTRLLGFASLNVNSIYAQMGRGKTERITAQALGSIAATVGKLAYDCCLYSSQNFGFIKLPDRYTTGSSIMPHKKNPDVFEVTRARCNRIQSLPVEIGMVTGNLPSGYFRDLQLVKESFLPVFDEMTDVLNIVSDMIEGLTVNAEAGADHRYDAMYSVEEVNRLVNEGVPFRDAYRRVGLAIENGTFKPDYKLNHTHIGSIGNPQNDMIRRMMDSRIDSFDFDTADRCLNSLAAPL